MTLTESSTRTTDRDTTNNVTVTVPRTLIQNLSRMGPLPGPVAELQAIAVEVIANPLTQVDQLDAEMLRWARLDLLFDRRPSVRDDVRDWNTVIEGARAYCNARGRDWRTL